jgi:hypothetical protein
MSLVDALFIRPWPFWAGGLAIGAFAVALAGLTGKGLGVSSGFGTLCSLVSGLPILRQRPFADRWRLWFLIGIPLGGLAATALAGKLYPKEPPRWLTGEHVPALAVLFLGGLLVGYGARLSGG